MALNRSMNDMLNDDQTVIRPTASRRAAAPRERRDADGTRPPVPGRNPNAPRTAVGMAPPPNAAPRKGNPRAGTGAAPPTRASSTVKRHQSGSRQQAARHPRGRTRALPCQQSERRRPAAHVGTHACTTVSFDSPSGGVGVSMLASLCALELSRREATRTCALADCDFPSGGLDIMLGLEADEGLRWSGIRAPLGRIEPDLLMAELPRVEALALLAADPWTAPAPGWWEVDATLRALQQACDYLILDRRPDARPHRPATRTEFLPNPSGPTPAIAVDAEVLLVELSVMGLARARAWLEVTDDGAATANQLIVGVEPRGLGSGTRRHAIDVGEAEDYLGHALTGVLGYDRAFHKSTLDGLGIAKLPRRMGRIVIAIVDEIVRLRAAMGAAGAAGYMGGRPMEGDGHG